jgi:hypothetical protein
MTHDVARIILASDIAESIFPDNSIIRMAINDDAFIYGKKVQLPQAGGVPTVTKNRTTYPLPVAKRADTLKDYDIDEYSTDASHIGWTEKMVATYGKTDSVIRDHKGVLETSTTEGVLFNWAPTGAGKIIRTTGGNRAASATTATGNRKKLTREDIIAIRVRMNKDNIPTAGRKLALNAEMFGDLLEDTNLLNLYLMGQALQATAELQRLFGFDIVERSTVLRYAAGLTARDWNVAGAATDHSGALAWHPSFVRSAISGVKVFLNPDQAAYQGDIMSALALVGASQRYATGLGVYAIVEDVAA